MVVVVVVIVIVVVVEVVLVVVVKSSPTPPATQLATGTAIIIPHVWSFHFVLFCNYFKCKTIIII